MGCVFFYIFFWGPKTNPRGGQNWVWGDLGKNDVFGPFWGVPEKGHFGPFLDPPKKGHFWAFLGVPPK